MAVRAPRLPFLDSAPGGRTEAEGDSSLAASTFRSVVDLWNHRVGSTPDAEAMTWRHPQGGWTSLTWREADRRVQRVANALLGRGLQPEDRCAILASTRAEWILADLGVLAAAGATTTLHPSQPAADIAWVLEHSGATVVFADADQLPKLLAVREQIPAVQAVVVFAQPGQPAPPADDPWIVDFDAFEAEGAAWATANPGVAAARAQAIAPDSLATLMYTSGTTGVPKGVMLTHDAWVYEAEALDALGVVSPADRQLLFLPLAHVFAKVLQVAFIRLGIPTVVDGANERLGANLIEQRPTWMGGVPRVFEKAWARILREAEAAGPARARMFRWALGVGREVSQIRQQGRQPTGLLRVKFKLADRLVFSKVKAGFGGRLRFFISGGAPLAREIAEFFHACDLLILEGYGLTESAAASFVNPPDNFRFGTVGPPLPGCKVRIADDGEILIKSRGVMKGYYRDPEATARALTPDGWLHTGDIGALLPSGHLQITDRKKDILVTAGGKNVAPAHLQNLLISRCPLIGQAVVFGDRRPYLTAAFTLDPDALPADLVGLPLAQVAADPGVLATLGASVDAVNRELPRYEMVRRFVVLPELPSPENGLLTPSLKIKRAVVEARYQALLDGLYADPPEEVKG